MATTRAAFWTWIWATRYCNGSGSGLSILMLGKLNLFHLTNRTTVVLLIWKWVGLSLIKNHLLRCWNSRFILNWVGVLIFSLLGRLSLRKLEPWFILWSFALLRFLIISINLSYDFAWHNVIITVLRLFSFDIWICVISITLVDVHLSWLNWFHFLFLWVITPYSSTIVWFFCHHSEML